MAAERATALDQGNAGLWRVQGRVLSELRRNGDALACFDRAVAAGSTNQGVWLGKATMHMRLRQYAQALAAFERAQEVGVREPLVVLNMAQALFELGRYGEALETAERGRAMLDVAADPTAAWTLVGRGLFALNRYEEALAAFKHAFVLHPEVWSIRTPVVRTQWRLGRFGDAFVTLVQAAFR